MESNGFEKVALIGSNVAAMMTNHKWNYWKEKSDEEMEKIIDLLIENATDPYLLGVSSHLLYIGKKK